MPECQFCENCYEQGAQYVLESLLEIFGAELTKTDVWKEFSEEEGN